MWTNLATKLYLAITITITATSAFASPDADASDGTTIEQPTLAARIFYPAESAKPGPAILVLGGAEGGRAWAESMSRMFASHGYVAMAETYFNAPGLPDQLQLVPLERFRVGIDRLAADPRVDPRRIAIVGLSKGAEAALIVASRDQRVAAVVAASPSDVVWEGIDRKAHTAVSSWSEAGEPIAYVPFAPCADCQSLAALYRASRDAASTDQSTAIPVEKISAPILMLSSEQDAVWPSDAMAKAVTHRLQVHHFRHAVETLRYPEGGHFTLSPPAPENAEADAGFGGGTPSGIVEARRQSWPHVVAFLDRSLRLR